MAVSRHVGLLQELHKVNETTQKNSEVPQYLCFHIREGTTVRRKGFNFRPFKGVQEKAEDLPPFSTYFVYVEKRVYTCPFFEFRATSPASG